jgi:peptide/nickel transport system ATP-binding protein
MEPQMPIKDDTILAIEDLTVAYRMRGGEVEALQHVTLALRRGETLGIVGESGCGKSTLGWSIVNFLGANGYVKAGSIRFEGAELVGGSEAELRKLRGNRIAMVFQDPMQALNPSLRLGEQMRETLVYHQKLSNTAADARCIAMLERVHMPDPRRVLQRYPHQISGGQQQRVVIAMALLNDPALLILDEPTTALDVTVEATVLDLIAELRVSLDTSLIFISHNLGVIARTCDRVAVMYAGEVVEQAPVARIFAAPRHPYTQGLLRCVPRLGASKSSSVLYPIPGQVPAPNRRPPGCLFAPRCQYAQARCTAERPALRQLGDGTGVKCHFAEEIDPAAWRPPAGVELPALPAVGEQEVVLDGRDVKKHYRLPGRTVASLFGLGKKEYVRAVEDVSFSARRGTTLGIVGESGSGKSTLVRSIIGLESIDGGKMEFMGIDIRGDLSQRTVATIRELQMVFQNPDSTMNPAYTVGQQIGRPLQRFKVVPDRAVRDEVIHLLEAVRLNADYYPRFPRQLSGGEKQRVGIARALASRPDLILCDEPVSALDVSVQAAVLNLLLEIQQRNHTTMVFIAHDLSVVRFLADQVAVMYLGQIVESGPVDAIYAPPYHPYTEALLSAVPVPDPTVAPSRIRLEGTAPSAVNPPPGCRFHTRCPRRTLMPDGGTLCTTTAPPRQDVGEGHTILCHLPLATLHTLNPIAHERLTENE